MRPGNQSVRIAARIHKLDNRTHQLVWNDDDRKKVRQRISLLVPEWWYCNTCGVHWDIESEFTLDHNGKWIMPLTTKQRKRKDRLRFPKKMTVDGLTLFVLILAFVVSWFR